jgi:hypothetical protein
VRPGSRQSRSERRPLPAGFFTIWTTVAIASRERWACTILAAVYTMFGIAFLWILPLFPAEPKLGPVYRQITHFIPWEFPLLIMVPAFVMDLIFQRTTAWRPIVRASSRARLFSACSLPCSGRSPTS